MRAATPPGRQSLLGNVLLSAAVTVLAAGAAELAARHFESASRPAGARPGAPGPPTWEKDWQGDFYLMPSSSLGWPASQPFNRDGVRDRTHSREKPEGTRRIVCLGDSVTLGPDHAPANSYPQLLQQELDRRGPGFEVFNVALWGWSPRQERIAYRRIVRAYAPDQVVLGLCLNDVQDLQNNLSRPPALLAKLHRRSALVRRLFDARGREIAGVEELFTASDSPRVRAGFDKLFAELRALRDDVRRDGASLSVLVFPYVAQVLPGAPAPSAQERIAAFCTAEQIACVDARFALAPLGAAAFEDGIHFATAGNQAVARLVVASGLVPDVDRARQRVAAATGLAMDAVTTEGAVIPLRGVFSGNGDAATRTAAAWALGQIGPAASTASAEIAATAMSGQPEPLRLAALASLPRIGLTAEGERALLSALADSRAPVRWQAAQSLSQSSAIDAPARVEALGSSLVSEDAYVRAFAAWALGDMGTPAASAVPSLVAALQDRDARQRALVMQALGRIPAGDQAAKVVATLAGLLRSGETEDRWRAARALARFGPAAAAARGPLEAALRDEDRRVRDEASRALSKTSPLRAGATEQ